MEKISTSSNVINLKSLPNWTAEYENKIHEFLLRQGVSIEESHSEEPG